MYFPHIGGPVPSMTNFGSFWEFARCVHTVPTHIYMYYLSHMLHMCSETYCACMHTRSSVIPSNILCRHTPRPTWVLFENLIRVVWKPQSLQVRQKKKKKFSFPWYNTKVTVTFSNWQAVSATPISWTDARISLPILEPIWHALIYMALYWTKRVPAYWKRWIKEKWWNATTYI